MSESDLVVGKIEQLTTNEPAVGLSAIAGCSPALLDALRKLSMDMHNSSTRHCGTCKRITDLIGEPFGCDYFRAQVESR